MNNRHLVRGALIGALVAVGILLLWVLITGLLAFRSAGQVQQQSQSVADALRAGDTSAAEQSLTELQASSASLAATLNSPPWTQMAGAPLVGPTVGMFAGIADGTAAVAAATQGNEQVIATTVADLKKEGASAAGQLSDLAPVTSAAAEGVAGPAERVAAVPADDLFAPMRQMALDRQEQFLGVAEGVTAADGAVVALPALLGAEGPRTWLVAVQNDAEARGTGGLLSAYAVVSVRNGRLTPQESGTTNDLFNAPAISVAGVPKDTQKLWGADQLGRWWGMNLDRHFPYAGLLMHRGSPAPVDDVITIDPRVVAGLLEVTGPISAAGVTVDEDSAEAFFTRDIYAQFPDPTKKDAVTVALIDQMMRKLAGGELNPVALWDALAAPASQGRLLTYSSDAKVQRALERMPTGGVVPTTPGPWASVALNDFGGSKMSAYLDTSVEFSTAAFCSDPATSTLTVSMTNDAPADLPDYVDVRSDLPGNPSGTGTTSVGVASYLPVGSAFRSATLDGQPVELSGGTDRDHPVGLTTVELERGQTRVLTVTFEEPRSAEQPVVFSPQPMVRDMSVTTNRAGC